MPEDFVVARNPEPDSSLPYLLRIPLGDGILLKAKDTWPRTSKVYCHRFFDGWPDEAEVVERVAVRSCVRRGAAIDLVLDRGRENRSQFVITTIRGGRQAVFWQTSRTAKQARPGVTVPKARAQGISDLEVVVDTGERYAWTFGDQQVTTRKQSLPAGDYAALGDDGAVLAAVERKSPQDLVGSLTTGKLQFQLTELAALPRAAVVVEAGYGKVVQHTHVRTAVIADGLAEAQVAFPGVPIVFIDNRKLAQEWCYRFLAAAVAASAAEGFATRALAGLAPEAPLPPLPPPEPTPAELRAWAGANGHEVSAKGRVPADVRRAWEEAHGG
ncbi:ERCC4 domain-containing protein [Nocardioides sp. J54]|uniref:ERCC4 domain-containing protein n=1 Tax=Nocardioides sp. J54 TaxID=935866 RepID=UPI00048E89F8|nr:ERCC4 domain-containing protein [Nocardioides sp. J54]